MNEEQKAQLKDELDILLGISPEGPICNCGGYHCPACESAREARKAIDAEIERRKQRSQR